MIREYLFRWVLPAGRVISGASACAGALPSRTAPADTFSVQRNAGRAPGTSGSIIKPCRADDEGSKGVCVSDSILPNPKPARFFFVFGQGGGVGARPRGNRRGHRLGRLLSISPAIS